MAVQTLDILQKYISDVHPRCVPTDQVLVIFPTPFDILLKPCVDGERLQLLVNPEAVVAEG